MNVAFFLKNSAGKAPLKTAIVSGERHLSYEELDERSSRLAGAMRSSGLEPGQRVAILFLNSHYYPETYFAALKAGLVAVLVNTRLAAPEIAYVIGNSEADALFYGPEFEDIVTEIRADMPMVKLFVSPRSSAGFGALDYDDFLSGGERLSECEPAGEDTPCQILYTSGTTGRPKGAVITHGGLVWNFFNTILAREDLPGQNLLIIGPLFHSAGLNNQMTIHIGLGGTCFLMPKFEPEAVLRTIQDEKIGVMVAAR